jgi:hypothetical protein
LLNAADRHRHGNAFIISTLHATRFHAFPDSNEIPGFCMWRDLEVPEEVVNPEQAVRPRQSAGVGDQRLVRMEIYMYRKHRRPPFVKERYINSNAGKR